MQTNSVDTNFSLLYFFFCSIPTIRRLVLSFCFFSEILFLGQYVSTQLLTWTEKGKSKLDTFLAKMGISKKECSQPYNFMSTSGKSKLRTKISQFKNEHDLDNLLYRSFTRGK